MFELSIVTPDKKLVSGAEMEEVFVPAERGELNILPGHSPLVSTLDPGVLKYRLKGSTEMNAVAISWGYVEVTPNGVNILAETAEKKSDIDLEKAKNNLKEIEQALDSAESPEDIVEYDKKRRRAEARINVVEKH